MSTFFKKYNVIKKFCGFMNWGLSSRQSKVENN